MQSLQKFKKTELGLIPENWNVKKFSDIGKIIGGGTPDTTKKEFWENGNIAWAVPTDLSDLKTNYIDRTERCITKKGLENSAAKLLPVGTVLITSRATIGECALNTIPMTTNQGFQSLICNSESNNLFFLYLIKFNKSKLIRKSHGTTFLEISKNNIIDLKFSIPTLKEQQKIASILSKVDELLQKTDQIIEQIQRLKKGLMQRLLTKGIGHTKFKKVKSAFGKYDEIPQEWEIIDLGEIIKDIRYGTSVKCSSTPQGIPILRIPNVVQGLVNVEDLKYAKLSKEDLKRFELEEGDIIFVRTNGNREYVGRCAVFHDLNSDYGFASYLIRVKLDVERLNPNFLTLELSLPTMKKQIMNQTKTSAGQYNLNTEGIKSLQIILPPLKMQNVITSIISNIENQIKINRIQKSKIEDIKKGLMQQLLTGKLRVKV